MVSAFTSEQASRARLFAKEELRWSERENLHKVRVFECSEIRSDVVRVFECSEIRSDVVRVFEGSEVWCDEGEGVVEVYDAVGNKVE